MIELITGLPGAGKTLSMLMRVKAWAEKEGREVYYSGIADLKLPWIELERGEDWHKCPPNSIVVIDEAQRIFRPRANGSQVPPHVAELETHRHKGIDLVLLTQQPTLVDKNVRQLVGRHYHVVRKFGLHRATMHEFPECRENTKSRKDSIRHDLKYPREVFSYYKSAEVHTHRARIPLRVWLMFASPLLIVAILWFAWGKAGNLFTGKGIKPSGTPGTSSGSAASGGSGSGAKASPVLTADQYMAELTPRIPGLAHTAPAYDKVTAAKHAPVPAACVQWAGKGCRCYTQQATRMDMSDDLCKQIAHRGFFVAWDDQVQRLAPAPAPVARAASESTGPHMAEIPAPESVSSPSSSAVTVAPKIYSPGSGSDPHRGGV